MPNTASVTGTSLSITVPLSNKSGFYRLQSP